MLKYIWGTILVLFVLTACQSDNENDKRDQSSIKNIEQATVDQPKSESKEQTISLENKLIPPKFIITRFEMHYIEDKNELLFKMNYEFDSEIYVILTEGNQEIHFILEYPENLVDILMQSHSDVIIAEKPSDYNTKYQVTFAKEIELTQAEVAKIKKNISGFNLLIADSQKDIISQFIDLYGFNQYAPEKSNNTYLDE